MKIRVVRHEMFDEASGVTAADDCSGGVWLFAEHFGGDSGSGGIGGVFGIA